MDGKIAVIDSSPASRQDLVEMLRALAPQAEIAEAGESTAALDLLSRLEPEVVVVQIRFPEIDSLLRRRSPSYQPYIIPLLDYLPGVIRLLDEHSLVYLVKPVSAESLAGAFRRVRHRGQKMEAHLRQVIAQVSHSRQTLSSVTVLESGEFLAIPVERICFLRASGALTSVHTDHGLYNAAASLDELGELLDERKFCRIRTGVIVATGKIKNLRRRIDGRWRLRMGDAARTQFTIERSRLNSFFQHYRSERTSPLLKLPDFQR